MHVIFDVSRLLTCVWRNSPSGIDRVEMAYAQRWRARPTSVCTFVAENPYGRFAAIPRDRLDQLVEALAEAWRGGTAARSALGRARGTSLRIHVGLTIGGGLPRLRARLAGAERCVFLLVSHRALERQRGIAAMRRAGAAFIPFVHDLIPLTHPEYTRPPQVRHHASRIATIAAQADGIIVNSAATAATLRPQLDARWQSRSKPAWPGRDGGVDNPPPLVVAPLGIEPSVASLKLGAAPTSPGYFVCLGTIEPRKNHLLLLHLWRDLAVRLGPAAPRLVLIGRRGWENENILDMLERCETLRGLVEERGTLGDAAVAPLLAGARALLFPSFAEGYGLPLAEALALGVPAVCADLPALREVGGEVPDFLDPLDGAAWRRAVLDYARPDSPARAAQLGRLAAWRAPSWDAHFAAVDGLLDAVMTRPVPAVVPTPAPARAPAIEPALPSRPRFARARFARPQPATAAWQPAVPLPVLAPAAPFPTTLSGDALNALMLRPDRPLVSADDPYR